ncbi:hypothetical protein [Methanocella arvoryzae]|uniref:ADP ribosyltransferase domain-containing protein n=1 Tax=Methanocella arvoryzae (strain DSM 22066 / NBRC 105507 / MRE50) TaxID=351160 RepID=Q0W1U9_METAR|nr:hypothetical protein [Methanocella arvoryzae]CAJ37644.1 hypothetical protein RCIX2591 [Methanocella arvoryzae MRE50]
MTDRSGSNNRGIRKLAAYAWLAFLFLAVFGTLVAVSELAPGSTLKANPGTGLPGAVYEGTITAIPVVPDELESATLQLTRPGSSSLIPYTERGFDRATVASIAWWKEPGFYDNTTEYRNYLRTTPEHRANYTEARKIYFDFTTANLDPAIAASPQKEDLILFRGISPTMARTVLTSGTYIELAYPSTTYDVTISLILFGARGDDGYKNVLVMQREKGEKSLYIDEEEREYLLPRDTQWNVIKAVNVENLNIEADFPLMSNDQTTDSVTKVRLIYITEAA